jgi:hypothetical protein
VSVPNGGGPPPQPPEPQPQPGQPAQVHFDIQVPEGAETGVYSNFLSVWHAEHDFTLDFCVTDQPRPDADGNVRVVCRVVARVKIPLTVAEDMLRALAENVTRYEEVAGRIRKPGEDLREPGDGGIPDAL